VAGDEGGGVLQHERAMGSETGSTEEDIGSRE
jgi:hypothetical protein